MEYLLWLTAVRALEGDLPEAVLPRVRTFAERAMALTQTPFAQELRARGDIVAPRPRTWQGGPLWRRSRLTSAQVLDAFFINGMLAGDDLQVHEGLLGAALALARAMEPAMRDDESRQALLEDTRPYTDAHRLLQLADQQGQGVYVWP
jgi:hypothetical protein